MRKLICTLIMGVALLGPPAQASGCAAEGTVQSAASAFMVAARHGSAQGFSSAAARYTDLRRLAMFALGPYRRDLPSEMEGHYISLARGFMGRFMASHSSGLSGGTITITSCSVSNGNTTVAGRLNSGSSVVFRLAANERIEDVSVSGISIAQALRSKFTGVIRDNGGDINALISYLEQ